MEAGDRHGDLACVIAALVVARDLRKGDAIEIYCEIAKESNLEIPTLPASITLELTTENAFDSAGLLPGHLEDRTRQCEECGYTILGDFLIPELSVVLRAWFREPNVFVYSYTHLLFGGGSDNIAVLNADDTIEHWCNWHLDHLAPPWVTRVTKGVPILDLHDTMLAAHSGKSPRQLTGEDFAENLRHQYTREMQWRQSL